MPRKTRQLCDGGIYHVYSRGNNRKNLFLKKEDFLFFLKILGELKALYRFDLFHYCLMTNHFHFLMRIQEGGHLPQIMHGLKLTYTRYYKKEYEFVGHLFQGRFKSPLIAEESYYLQCGRYIERNPVSAKMVDECHDYIYSSAAYYVLGNKDELVNENLYYHEMGNNDLARREAYRKFVAVEDPYKLIVDEAMERV